MKSGKFTAQFTALATTALIASFAAPASAQSNVTLYGIVDVGVEQTRLNPGSDTLRLSSGIQSGSRWGLKGTEDLGGGLSASFKLESGFDATTGASAQGGRLFGRQSWVGVDGGFGSLKFGRQYTPLFIAIDTVDPFDAGITGDGSGIAAVFRAGGVRTDNTVDYSTPKMGGFSGEVSYSFGENTGSTSAGQQLGLGLTYEGGPLTLVFAHHDQNVAATTPAGAAVSLGHSKTTMVGGVYAFGSAKLHGAYAVNRDNIGGLTTEKSRDAMIGVSAPVGPVALMASYVRHTDKLVANANADYWQLGATYDLSKRTNLYTSYSTIRNGSAGAVGSGVAGVDISWLNVGMRHRF